MSAARMKYFQAKTLNNAKLIIVGVVELLFS
jgi:hypothetical protein